MKVVNPVIINAKHAQVHRVMNAYHAKEKEAWSKIDADVLYVLVMEPILIVILMRVKKNTWYSLASY
jgi:hypothetical protein